MHIKFQKNGVTKEVKVGFSWTTFFFGWLVAVSRGMWPQALIMIFTLGLAGLYFMFTINQIQAHNLMVDGWEIANDDKAMAFAKWGIK